MEFDLLLRDVRLPDAKPGDPSVGVAVRGGTIAAIAPGLDGSAKEVVEGGNRLLSPGFVETHIHLDKSCILDRCACEPARFPHGAMERVSAVKNTFTVEDVNGRARGTLEKCILHGTTRMRTHVEVDPKVGLRGFHGVKALVDAFAWAIDIEICVMPQEGLTNNPGTDELMVEALRSGARVVGAAPNYDSDRAAQIHRVFEMAREFDVDIDMHLDSGHLPADLDLLLVCDLTEKHGWGGRVAIGHVTKLAHMPLPEFDGMAKRLADAGVALTVLPSTDLYLMARAFDHAVPRGVVDANRLAGQGVTCSLASNNILNPFTPFGDGQLIRQANLYANVVQRGTDEDMLAAWAMITTGAARILRCTDYGIAVGNPADFVLVDAPDAGSALREIRPTLMGFKRGRRTFTRSPAVLHRPA
jgi:cytosine deaminase